MKARSHNQFRYGEHMPCEAGNAAWHYRFMTLVPEQIVVHTVVYICRPGRCFEYSLVRLVKEDRVRYLEHYLDRFTVFGREITPAFPEITYRDTVLRAWAMEP